MALLLSLSTAIGLNNQTNTSIADEHLNLNELVSASVGTWVDEQQDPHDVYFLNVQAQNKLQLDQYILASSGGDIDDLVTLLTGVDSGATAKKFTSVVEKTSDGYVAASPSAIVLNTSKIETTGYDGTVTKVTVKYNQSLQPLVVLCSGNQSAF